MVFLTSAYAGDWGASLGARVCAAGALGAPVGSLDALAVETRPVDCGSGPCPVWPEGG